jgi:hypothetical protein
MMTCLAADGKLVKREKRRPPFNSKNKSVDAACSGFLVGELYPLHQSLDTVWTVQCTLGSGSWSWFWRILIPSIIHPLLAPPFAASSLFVVHGRSTKVLSVLTVKSCIYKLIPEYPQNEIILSLNLNKHTQMLSLWQILHKRCVCSEFLNLNLWMEGLAVHSVHCLTVKDQPHLPPLCLKAG